MTRPTSPMGSSSEPGHEMRITSGGSIDNYVKFATDFLLDNPQRYLILHTLPSATPTTPSKSSKPPPKSTTSLHSCTTNIPRLISVVETIKRSLTQPSPLFNQDGTEGRLKKRRRVKGVWQYNESGSLVVDNEETEREDPLLRVLSGISKPRMLHRPYLQITLSTRPLGLEKGQNVTVQYTPNKPSKGESFANEEDEQSAGTDDGMPLGDVHSSLTSNRPKNQKRKSSLGADEVVRKRKKGKKDKKTSLRIGGDV